MYRIVSRKGLTLERIARTQRGETAMYAAVKRHERWWKTANGARRYAMKHQKALAADGCSVVSEDGELVMKT